MLYVSIMEKEPKPKPLQILLSEAEREELAKAAKAASMPVGTYIRAKALEAARG